MYATETTFKRLLPIVLTLLLLLTCLSKNYAAPADTLQLKKLRKEMYYHYSKRHTKEFLATISQLKQLSLKLGRKDEYYKAVGNEAIYTSTNINRNKGVELAKLLYEQAEREQDKFGLYTSNYVLGTIFASISQLDEARSHYRDALHILQKYYPEEGLSPLYLAMTKVERALKHYDKADEYVDYVLNDPKATNQHRMSAMTYRYLSFVDREASVAERDKAYGEREKMKAILGHDDNFGYIIDFDQALIHRNYQRAESIIDSLRTATKTYYQARLSYAKEDYKSAYNYLMRYKHQQDSINNDYVRKQTYDMGIMLDKSRAENEAKNLRLSNQMLKIEQIENELKQKKLEEEALNMSLLIKTTKLNEMEAQRQNDSLMAGNKDLKISEYHVKMKALETEERARRNKYIAIIITSGLVLGFVAIYANTRRLQLRRLKEAYDKLEETTTAKERIESELRIARDIQMSMVPSKFPQHEGLDIFAQMTPAKEVGGDLYDCLLNGEQLYFCVGDVSGKGVPASLFMAQTMRLFRAFAKRGYQPSVIATRINEELTENNENGMFVTMFMGVLDLKTGHLDFCNAGHNPPILDQHFIDMEPNAPLGLWEGLEYEGESLDDISSKRLFIYSDGLNEAENHIQDQYSDDRLLTFLRTHADDDCRSLIAHLQEDVEKHVNGADPSDDLTMLCLKYK